MTEPEGKATTRDLPMNEPLGLLKQYVADFKDIGYGVKGGLNNEVESGKRLVHSVKLKFKVFTTWHTESSSLWREIYARTVATLLAGLIAYMIAVWTTGAPKEPLRFLALAGAIVGFFSVVLMIAKGMSDVLKSGVPSYQDVIYMTPHILRRTFVAIFFFAVGTLCIAWFNDVPFWEQLSILGPPVAVVVVVLIILYLGAVAKMTDKAPDLRPQDEPDDGQLSFDI